MYSDEKKIFSFLDFHGHSSKKNSFLYGPEFPIWDSNYLISRVFAKLVATKTPLFRYHSCLFRISNLKKRTARAIFSALYSIIYCYTIEVSNGLYYLTGNPVIYKFNVQTWIEVGRNIIESLVELTKYDSSIDAY